MGIEITLVPKTEKHILRNLMELYLYDFSEFDAADVDANGIYGYHWFEHYWGEENRYPFLIRKDGKLAGFVLVTRYNYFDEQPDCWVIAEFFVMRKYRHLGVGEFAARQTFDRFPGEWQVGQLRENTPAIAFWRKIIQRYTAGNYQEIWMDDERWRGPVQIFHSPGVSGG